MRQWNINHKQTEFGVRADASSRAVHQFLTASPRYFSLPFSLHVSPTEPLFETHCCYVEARLSEFLSWTQNGADTDVGPFIEYPKSEFWAYADYKYIATLFQDVPSMFEVLLPVCCLSPIFPDLCSLNCVMIVFKCFVEI